jgi:hypothetical protein
MSGHCRTIESRVLHLPQLSRRAVRQRRLFKCQLIEERSSLICFA